MNYSGRKRKRSSASNEENSGKRRRNTLDKWNVTTHSGCLQIQQVILNYNLFFVILQDVEVMMKEKTSYVE